MAEYVTKIRTEDGDKQIDYNALANLPTTDESLSVSGKSADAKATGDAIADINAAIEVLDEDMDYIYSIHYELEDSLMPTNHATSDTTYGIGTEENYGHVKLYDKNVLSDSELTPEDLPGLAVTPYALREGLFSVSAEMHREVGSLEDYINTKAPIAHTSEIGNLTKFGHVKLSDSTDEFSDALTGGTAATPKAVRTVDRKVITLQKDLYALKIPELVDWNDEWINIPNGEYYDVPGFTTSESGLYMIEAYVTYYQNANGIRFAQLTTTGGEGGMIGGMKIPACTSAHMQTQMYLSQCIYLGAGTVVKIKLQQDSGSDLGVKYCIRHSHIPIPDSYENPREPGLIES